jgi:hypothetical protein
MTRWRLEFLEASTTLENKQKWICLPIHPQPHTTTIKLKRAILFVNNLHHSSLLKLEFLHRSNSKNTLICLLSPWTTCLLVCIQDLRFVIVFHHDPRICISIISFSVFHLQFCFFAQFLFFFCTGFGSHRQQTARNARSLNPPEAKKRMFPSKLHQICFQPFSCPS